MLGYDEWLEGLERGRRRPPRRPGPVFRETVEECFAAGLLKVVFATETLSLGINMPARSVVIERFSKYGGAGRATLTSGEYLQLTGRAGRRGLDDEGHAVVAVVQRDHLRRGGPGGRRPAARTCAPPSGPPTTWRSTWSRRFDRETAHEVLHRSFAQWQARKPDLLSRQLGHRLAVLERAGLRRSGLEPDAGRAAAVPDLPRGRPPGRPRRWASDVLDGRRARPCWPASCPRSSSSPAGPAACPGTATGRAKREAEERRLQDRLGDKRTAELGRRGEALAVMAERIRASRRHHLVPRTRQPAPGLATAVASWVRGASFSTALAVAARDAGDLAPGDFVRTMKSVADLAQQVSHIAEDPAVAAAAREAVDLLVRGVVAGGLPTV